MENTTMYIQPKLAIVVSIALGAGLFALVCWRVIVALNTAPSHVVLVTDASDSIQRNCNAESALIRPLASRPVASSRTFTYLRTGDRLTRLEPVELFSGRLPQPPLTTMFGGRKKAEAEMEGFLRQAATVCAQAGQTDQSPIAKAVRRAVVQLKAAGCQRRSGCLLIVHSDLQDNDELALENTKRAAAATIDNRDIEVILCGYSEGVKDRASPETDSLIAQWEKLFTAPVKIAPFCSPELLGSDGFATGGAR